MVPGRASWCASVQSLTHPCRNASTGSSSIPRLASVTAATACSQCATSTRSGPAFWVGTGSTNCFIGCRPISGRCRCRRPRIQFPLRMSRWYRPELQKLSSGMFPFRFRPGLVSGSSDRVALAKHLWRERWSAPGCRHAVRFAWTGQHWTAGEGTVSAPISATCRRMSNCFRGRSQKTSLASRTVRIPRRSWRRPVLPAFMKWCWLWSKAMRRRSARTAWPCLRGSVSASPLPGPCTATRSSLSWTSPIPILTVQAKKRWRRRSDVSASAAESWRSSRIVRRRWPRLIRFC
jgi:hypothetical protein